MRKTITPMDIAAESASTRSLWQEEQLKTLSQKATKQQVGMIARIPTLEMWSTVPHIETPNYQPDQAVRAAILAPDTWKRWKHDRKDGKGSTDYLAHHHEASGLRVYLGGPRPPTIEEARAIVEEFRLNTVITGRIVLAIWLQRRYENSLAINGSALIRLDEILAIRGVKKSSQPYHSDYRNVTYSNGYRWVDRQAILGDLTLLQQCYVCGPCTIYAQKRWQPIGIDAQYLRFSILLGEGEEPLGITVSAGDYIIPYQTHNNIYIAAVEREVFKLHPRQQRHETLIGLFLTERWRDLAKKQDYDRPISMQELLEASVIPFDRKNPSRFIERIEDALETLWTRGILGGPARCLTPIDRKQKRWTEAWLASQWMLIPPETIVRHYQTIGDPARILSLSSAHSKRKKT